MQRSSRAGERLEHILSSTDLRRPELPEASLEAARCKLDGDARNRQEMYHVHCFAAPTFVLGMLTPSLMGTP